MRCKLCLPVLLLILTACSGMNAEQKPLTAGDNSIKQVTVEGSASILEFGLSQARQAAIDDAIAQASSRLKPQRGNLSFMPGDIKIVDEWQADNQYHVQGIVMLTQQSACQSIYRKKLLATGFPVMNADQISGTESQDLFSGIPREISNRLMEKGDYIARNLTKTVLYARPDLAPEIYSPTGSSGTAVITDIAKQMDAQFVLSGVIRSFKTESTEYVRGTGVMAMLKSSMRDYIGRRSIDVDVFVHDGFSGSLLFQHRYSDSILGDVSLPAGYTVGSEGFESSPAGHKISEIINLAVDDIRALFTCHPFATRVVQVDHNRITIAAGAQNKLKVGDRFMIYSAGFSDDTGAGFTNPIGLLIVSQVGASTSVGSLDGEIVSASVRPGDWVRSFSLR